LSIHSLYLCHMGMNEYVQQDGCMSICMDRTCSTWMYVWVVRPYIWSYVWQDVHKYGRTFPHACTWRDGCTSGLWGRAPAILPLQAAHKNLHPPSPSSSSSSFSFFLEFSFPICWCECIFLFSTVPQPHNSTLKLCSIFRRMFYNCFLFFPKHFIPQTGWASLSHHSWKKTIIWLFSAATCPSSINANFTLLGFDWFCIW